MAAVPRNEARRQQPVAHDPALRFREAHQRAIGLRDRSAGLDRRTRPGARVDDRRRRIQRTVRPPTVELKRRLGGIDDPERRTFLLGKIGRDARDRGGRRSRLIVRTRPSPRGPLRAPRARRTKSIVQIKRRPRENPRRRSLEDEDRFGGQTIAVHRFEHRNEPSTTMHRAQTDATPIDAELRKLRRMSIDAGTIIEPQTRVIAERQQCPRERRAARAIAERRAHQIVAHERAIAIGPLRRRGRIHHRGDRGGVTHGPAQARRVEHEGRPEAIAIARDDRPDQSRARSTSAATGTGNHAKSSPASATCTSLRMRTVSSAAIACGQIPLSPHVQTGLQPQGAAPADPFDGDIDARLRSDRRLDTRRFDDA